MMIQNDTNIKALFVFEAGRISWLSIIDISFRP
jgi:hypothetical protein